MKEDHQTTPKLKPPSRTHLVDKPPTPAETPDVFSTGRVPTSFPVCVQTPPPTKSPARHTLSSLPPKPPSASHLDNIVRKIERQKTKILSPSLLLDSPQDDDKLDDKEKGNGKEDKVKKGMMRMNVMIATSNMGNAMPSHSDISSLIPQDGGDLYDVIVLGLQEATFGEDDVARGMEEEEEGGGDIKVGKGPERKKDKRFR
jgi:hypothetical protein